MSRGMQDLAVNSGELSFFYKRGLTGLTAQNATEDLWDLPAGSLIYDAWITVRTADTDTATANPDCRIQYLAGPVVVVTRDLDATGFTAMTKSATLNDQLAADKTLQFLITAAADGDYVVDCVVLATRPGPEPQ